jgi:predicted HTH domain antitoxin
MSTKPYALRLPKGLLELAELKSKADRTDKATALRQWLYAGAEEYVLKLLSEGRLTIGRAAELLEMSIHDVQRLAQEHGIELGATANQYHEARKTAERLTLKLRASKRT